ncbi:MAG: 50S ribosomal protein L9 [Acidobacteriota bacterium]|nr:50S ribosomal protein L9 [Acidobacteriota bacterium]
MATTQVLLREDVDNLGGRGEIVKVKAGYARNYLIPRGIAITATKGNVKQVENERAALLKKEAKEKSTAEIQGEQMRGLRLSFERRAGEHGLLFGSVTTMDVAEALRAKGYEIDRKRISLDETIKELGDYTAHVRLHREVTIEIPIEVLGEGGQRAQKNTDTPETAENAVANQSAGTEAGTETANV